MSLRRWNSTSALLACLATCVALSSGCARDAEMPPATPAPTSSLQTSSPLVFAIIGDFGSGDSHERAVADLVTSWNPTFIVTTGDNFYRQAGGIGTGRYHESVGDYYGAWLKDVPPTGELHRSEQPTMNAFFPTMGNHDYLEATPAPESYLDYFTLPGSDLVNTSGNERYYDFVEGPVHFFILNSNSQEPAGTSETSGQGKWLQSRLAASESPWNVVCVHHPPYSSDSAHGSTSYTQWPYSAWGADAVVSGHAHTYERVLSDDLVYFVNGLGGAERYDFSTPVDGSAARYADDWGAQKVTVTGDAMTFEFYNTAGDLVDRYRLSRK